MNEYYTVEIADIENKNKKSYKFLKNFNWYFSHLETLFNYENMNYEHTQKLLNIRINDKTNVFSLENLFSDFFNFTIISKNKVLSLKNNECNFTIRLLIDLQIDDINFVIKKNHILKVENLLNKRDNLFETNEKCSICWDNKVFLDGFLNNCKHTFCYTCILAWSEKINKCPICKVKFMKIKQTNEDGITIKDIDISDKSIQLTEDEIEEDLSENFCYKCDKDTDKFIMMVCDYCNIKVCHIYCLIPKLETVPEDEWYCDFCVLKFSIVNKNPIAGIFDVEEREPCWEIPVVVENYIPLTLKEKIEKIKNLKNSKISKLLNNETIVQNEKKIKLCENLYLIQ